MGEGGTAGVDRRRLLAGAFSLCLPVDNSASSPPITLGVAAMRADLLLLQRAWTTLHPGLFRYATPTAIDTRFAAARDAICLPLSLGDFYVRLSYVTASIRCGHSFANPTNQKRAIREALFEAPTRLPLEWLWLGDRMIVTADPFATGIAPGSEVLAIDGRPAGAVLAAMLPLTRADGHNDAKRRRLLSAQGEERYETFDLFYPALFGERDRYRLTVGDPAGRRCTAEVAAVTLAQRQTRRAQDRPDGEPIWSIERRGGAAVLTMDDWALYDSKWDWRSWLHAAVDRLIADRVPGLVVDIRRNEGGQDCGDELIARLIDRPVAREAARRLVTFETLPADLRPYCDTWDRSFDRLGVGAERYDSRFRALAGEAGDQTIAPRGSRYTGRVAVLTGPQNSSATFQFAGAMARLKLGTLVGEETGGNRRGINGGCFYFLRLPGTGFEVDLPLIGNFPLTPQPDAGIHPAVRAPLTAAAVAAGGDPALDRALALVANG